MAQEIATISGACFSMREATGEKIEAVLTIFRTTLPNASPIGGSQSPWLLRVYDDPFLNQRNSITRVTMISARLIIR
jgi:hypothetical protein